MNLNSIIFPAPKSSFKYRKLDDHLIWIPKQISKKLPNTLNLTNTPSSKYNSKAIVYANADVVESAIPCLYLPYARGSNKILLYFHGNAEDIGWAVEFSKALRDCLKVNVLSMEYPGYSLYIGQPDAITICKDAEIVFDFIVLEMGIMPCDIFLFGRSIGSGVATYLASHRDPGALFLMAPIASIVSVVEEVIGKIAKIVVAERFKNFDEIKEVKCPTYFIHGKADTLVPYKHTIDMMNVCKCISDMNLPEDMTHNDFRLITDIINPILTFLKKCSITIINNEKYRIDFPKELYERPKYTYTQTNKRHIISQIYDRLANIDLF